MVNKVIITVEEDMEGERVDALVAEQISGLSRTTVKNLIKEGRILVDGRACKSSYRPSEGQEILVEIPAPEQLETPAQNLPLHIIYQDGDLVTNHSGSEYHFSSCHTTIV
jgi:23S rRNA pseudouridine1911/1915/1917 synthase